MEPNLRNVALLGVTALVAGIALGCLYVVLRRLASPAREPEERDGWPFKAPYASFPDQAPYVSLPDPHGSFCPFGEDRGPGQGCLKSPGHEGAHMLFYHPAGGVDLDR